MSLGVGFEVSRAKAGPGPSTGPGVVTSSITCLKKAHLLSPTAIICQRLSALGGS